MSSAKGANTSQRSKGMWQRVAGLKKRAAPSRPNSARSPLSRAVSTESRASQEEEGGVNDDRPTFDVPAHPHQPSVDLAEYEQNKMELEQLRMQQTTTHAQLPLLNAQLERANKSLEIVRAENERKSTDIDAFQKEVRRLKDRVNILEYKSMDLEKLEIAAENSKKAIEASQQKLLETERHARRSERTIAEQTKTIVAAEEKSVALTSLMADLKVQVKEELARNGRLEDKVSGISRLEETLQEQSEEMETMKRSLEEKTCLARHARNMLREEKDKNKRLAEQREWRARQTDDLALAVAETATLKQLLLAKDTLLVKRAQTVASVEAALKDVPDSDLKRKLTAVIRNEPHFRATYPHGCRVSVAKHSVIFEDEAEELTCETNISLPGSMPPPTDDDSDVTSALHSPRRVPVVRRATNFLQTLLNSDERECAATSRVNVRDVESAATSRGNVRDGNVRDVVRLKTCIVRPQTYHSTFADFRGAATVVDDRVIDLRDVATPDGDEANDTRGRKPKRSRSAKVAVKTSSPRRPGTGSGRNRAFPPEVGSSCSSSASGKCFVRTMSLLSSASRSPSRDARIASVVRVGDRVMAELRNKRDKTKGQHGGIVQYIGSLGRKHSSNILYAGIKFDDKVGDSDGTYNSTRYFTCCSKRGSFVRLAKIVSLLDKKTGDVTSVRCLLSRRKVSSERPSGVKGCRSD